MKTITVTDEMHEFLMSLSNELNTQDNRVTASPYYFQVQTDIEIAAHEGCGNEIYVDEDGDLVLRTESDIEDYIKQCESDRLNIDTKDVVLSEIFAEEDAYYDSSSWLDDHNFRKLYVEDSTELKNVFLTESAVNNHILRNKHHYQNPVSYVNYSFRNPELEKVLNFLKNLSK